MARRNDNTRKELKEMAIEAGIALLEAGGSEELSARKIAVRIGYTVGTLYNLFTNFEDIILHINSATLRDMHDKLATIADSSQEPHQRILDFAYCYGDYALAYPSRWNLLHGFVRTTKLPEWFRTQVDALFALVEVPLNELCPHQPSQARDAAKILWAGLHGICALSIRQKLEHVDAGPMRKLTDNFVTHYLKGLMS